VPDTSNRPKPNGCYYQSLSRAAQSVHQICVILLCMLLAATQAHVLK
jgi:hypothetical protein